MRKQLILANLKRKKYKRATFYISCIIISIKTDGAVGNSSITWSVPGKSIVDINRLNMEGSVMKNGDVDEMIFKQQR